MSKTPLNQSGFHENPNLIPGTVLTRGSETVRVMKGGLGDSFIPVLYIKGGSGTHKFHRNDLITEFVIDNDGGSE